MASKYYYNDVILPGLPNTGSYSNHYIIRYSSATGYADGYLLLATDAAAYYSSYGVETPASTNALAWTCTDGKTWSSGGQYDVSDKYFTDIGTVVWTHYDISYEDGAIYMEGSEPVLIEEAAMKRFIMGFIMGLRSRAYIEGVLGSPDNPDMPDVPDVPDVPSDEWPSDTPVTEDVIDVAVKKYDVRADMTDKFLLKDDEGNITVGYPLKEIATNMASYNGHKLPDIGNANTRFVFRNSNGEYIYYVLEDGCEAYSYFMWSDQYKEYRLVRNQDKAIQWARYKLNSSGEWKLDDRSNYFGSSLVFVGNVEVIWIGSDIYAEDKTVLHSAGAYTYEKEAKDFFTITYYDPVTTEFKARCWLRAAYHTTGEYAGQVTIDNFVSTESEGNNFIKNIRYCTREKLYYNGVEVWPNYDA